MAQRTYVAVFGNPIDGVVLVGPFETASDASDYAHNYAEYSDDEGRVAGLEPPPEWWYAAQKDLSETEGGTVHDLDARRLRGV